MTIEDIFSLKFSLIHILSSDSCFFMYIKEYSFFIII